MDNEIGPYKLEMSIGRGAFGEVWKARRTDGNKPEIVALKIPSQDEIDLEEARIWKNVSGHPNIIPLIEAKIYHGKAVYVTEFVEEGSLHDLLKNNWWFHDCKI